MFLVSCFLIGVARCHEHDLHSEFCGQVFAKCRERYDVSFFKWIIPCVKPRCSGVRLRNGVFDFASSRRKTYFVGEL